MMRGFWSRYFGRTGKVDTMKRMQRARALTVAGRFEDATTEFVWLWNHMLEHDPSMSGVRRSFMAGDMHDLASRSEEARIAFAALRDELNDRLEDGRDSRDSLRDWLALSIDVLGDDAAVRAWIDRVWEHPAGADTLRSAGHQIERWLIEQGEWAKAGVAQMPIAAFLKRERMLREAIARASRPSRHAQFSRDIDQPRWIDRCAVYHAACLAAGREEEAWAAADALLEEVDAVDDALAALCRDALRAGAVRARHAEMAGRIPGTEGQRLSGLIVKALRAGD